MASASAAAGHETELIPLTAERGVPYIASRIEATIASEVVIELLAHHAFDIIQPDIVHVGGISEMFKVGHMSNAYGVQFNPHFWGSGISLSATLHVAACLPSNPPSYVPEP